jgi:hypothetical protein
MVIVILKHLSPEFFRFLLKVPTLIQVADEERSQPLGMSGNLKYQVVNLWKLHA